MSYRELLERALDALEAALDESVASNHVSCRAILTAQIDILRAVLNQQQAEPDAVLAEREACANIAREVGTNTLPEDFALDRCYEIESAIRARGQQVEPVACPITLEDTAHLCSAGICEVCKQQAEPVAWGLFSKHPVNNEWVLQHPVRFSKEDASSDRAMYEKTTVLDVRPLYTAPQQEEPPMYRLAETDIYDFAGWLTTRPGLMEVGESYEAGPMAEAVGEYLRTYPERFAPRKIEDE